MSKTASNRIQLGLFNDPKAAVELRGQNKDLLAQIEKNKMAFRIATNGKWRSEKDLVYRPAYVLLIDVKVNGIPCRVDANALGVTFFRPRNENENWALREMAETLRVYLRSEKGITNDRRLAYAQELFWLVVTGQIKSSEAYAAEQQWLHDAGLLGAPEIAPSDVQQLTNYVRSVKDRLERDAGTWNTYEPEFSG